MRPIDDLKMAGDDLVGGRGDPGNPMSLMPSSTIR